eukprot:evm.model.scf_181EXC.4 EVM.evm.TU.scf_181EXC.4   scf_181EXC:15301-18457(+)
MELELLRNDVLQTAPTAPRTMVVLPPGSNKQQKVAVGDGSGVLQCFSVKRGEVAQSFKTLPSRQRITHVALGRGRQQRDKLFVAEGPALRGVNKKGREFFRFATNMTERIGGLAVCEQGMWISGEYTHSHFVEAREVHFHLAADRINATEVVPIASPQDLTPVLACQDRVIRTLDGSAVRHETPVEGAPICLRFVLDSHDTLNRCPDGKEVLYGTESGQLGQLFLEPDRVTRGFCLPNAAKLGGITAVYAGIDFTKDGVSDIVVGRDDGQVEIYGLDDDGELQQVFKTNVSETIHAIEGGYITSPSSQDVVVQTFSGKVLAYSSPEGGLFQAVPPKASFALRRQQSAKQDDEETRYRAQIDILKGEVGALQQQLQDKKEKAERGAQAGSRELALPAVDIVQRCRIDLEDAAHVLTVEVGASLFAVAVQCDVDIELLDTDSNIAILSRSTPSRQSGDKVLATYRCQEATHRLEIKFRAQEGKAGKLQLIVLPNVTPKTAQIIEHRIKPLCLHERLPQEPQDKVPMSEVTVSGQFSLSEFHTWLDACLSDVPPRLVDDSVTLHFRSAVTGTTLTCQYRAKEARLRSDSVTALAIAREGIMQEATAHNQRVTLKSTLDDKSVERCLHVMWPKFVQCRDFDRKLRMLEALEELKLQDGDVSYLSPELKETLERSSEITKEHKRQPQRLAGLTQQIRDLARDWSRLSGFSVSRQRMGDLDALLQRPNSSFDTVLNVVLGQYEAGQVEWDYPTPGNLELLLGMLSASI